MKRYRLDPKNPRQLTDEEARRLDEAAIDYSDIPPLFDQIDWTNCPDVESVPGRCSGAWVVKGTRVPVQAVLEFEDTMTTIELEDDTTPIVNEPG